MRIGEASNPGPDLAQNSPTPPQEDSLAQENSSSVTLTRPSQRQISSQRLSALLPLIVLPLELSPGFPIKTAILDDPPQCPLPLKNANSYFYGGGLVFCLRFWLFERQKQHILATLRQKREKGRNKKEDQNWSCFSWSKVHFFPSFKQHFD